MTSKFVQIVPPSHRIGNCIPFAAVRWHDFGIHIAKPGRLIDEAVAKVAVRIPQPRVFAAARNNGYEVIEIAVSDLDDKGAMVRHFRKLAGYLEQPELRQSVKDDRSWFERARQGT